MASIERGCRNELSSPQGPIAAIGGKDPGGSGGGTGDGSGGAAWQMYSGFQPLEQTIAPGPSGGTMTAVPFGPARYAISSNPAWRAAPMIGDTVQVQQFSGNKRAPSAFVGALASRGYQYSERENGVTYNFRDAWYLLADTVITLPGSERMTVGEILANINSNLYTDIRWNKAQQKYETIVSHWDPDPLPKIGGKRVALAIPLSGSWMKIPGLRIDGQPVAKILADLIQFARLIPDIEYGGGTVTVVGRKRGARQRSLVLGRVGRVMPSGDWDHLPSVAAIRGTVDYSGVINRVVGRGGLERESKVFDLIEGWTPDAEALWLSDKGVRDVHYYKTVGTVYTMPFNAWPFNAQSGDMRGNVSGPPDVRTDRLVLWERNGAGDPWRKSASKFKVVLSRADGQTDKTALDRGGFAPFTSGGHSTLVFESPQVVEYYTLEQQDARSAGVETSPTVGFKEFQLQCMIQGEELTADSGMEGSFPRLRKRYHTNRDIAKLTDNDRYDVGTDGRRKTKSHDASDDPENILKDQVIRIVRETSKPSVSVQITLRWMDLSWRLGDMITDIADIGGSPVAGGLGWIVEGIRHSYQDGVTVLECSNNFQTFQAGVRL